MTKKRTRQLRVSLLVFFRSLRSINELEIPLVCV